MEPKHSPHYLPSHSLSQYLLIDIEKEYLKTEFCKGVIHSFMPGASLPHNQILSNMNTILSNFFDDKPCNVFPADARVYVASAELMAFPDIVVLCEVPQMFDNITILNPSGLVEILSPSTEKYDRYEKVPAYLQIPSIKAVALVAQKNRRVEIFTPDGAPPTIIENEGTFMFLGCEISLKQVYKKTEQYFI